MVLVMVYIHMVSECIRTASVLKSVYKATYCVLCSKNGNR